MSPHTEAPNQANLNPHKVNTQNKEAEIANLPNSDNAQTAPAEQPAQQNDSEAPGNGTSYEKQLKQQTLNLQRLLERLDNTGIAQYVRLMENTAKVLWLNFLSGIARGLGFTVGTALVLAIAYKIISTLIKMNIPYLTDLLQNLVQIIQGAAQ